MIELEKLASTAISPQIVLPQITTHGTAREILSNDKRGGRMEIAGGLEIDAIKHTINVEMINTIMVLQVW